MSRQLRHTTTADARRAVLMTDAALEAVKAAIYALREAGATNALKRARSIRKSVEGAHRHATRMLAATRRT